MDQKFPFPISGCVEDCRSFRGFVRAPVAGISQPGVLFEGSRTRIGDCDRDFTLGIGRGGNESYKKEKVKKRGKMNIAVRKGEDGKRVVAWGARGAMV